jgi:hypothetical protein
MRQLKDRIVHHFHMQPLSRNILESYLMFRMRAAGYHGPDIFSPGAVKLIADASNGLMRRVNILADKSLLAAFVEDTYYIKTHHVQAALRDSDIQPARSLPGKRLLLAGAAAAVLLAGLAAWWFINQKSDEPARPVPSAALPAGAIVQDMGTGTAGSASAAVATQTVASQSGSMPVSAAAVTENPAVTLAAIPAAPDPKPNQDKAATGTAIPSPAAPPAGNPVARKAVLFEQRLAAGRQLLEQNTAVASIQLFYNEEINPDRIEGFLMRADKLGKLHEIYLLPTKFGSKDGIRVLYGAYPSVDAARKATGELPKRYKEAFATSIHIF